MQILTKNTCLRLAGLALISGISAKVAAENIDYSMILVGGGLHSCSSMNSAQCRAGHPFKTSAAGQAKSAEIYQISTQAISRIDGAAVWTAGRQLERQQVRRVLVQLLQQHGGQHWQAATLLKAIDTVLLTQPLPQPVSGFNGLALSEHLSEAELNLLMDELEQPLLDSQQRRLTERVDLLGGTDSFSEEIYRKIAEQAAKINKNGDKTRILVVTASSRDPFAAVDFYLDVFRQTMPAAQLEVSWLPLNAAYQRAQQQNNGCRQLAGYLRHIHRTYNRAAVYPDLMARLQRFCQDGATAAVAQIRSADAIFFNGGDQSLMLQALQKTDGSDSAELQAIREQFAAGRLLIAGTSAGTAVQTGNRSVTQPLPMISNGTSLQALSHAAKAAAAPEPGCDRNQSCPAGMTQDQLTYQANGGLGLFPFGVLDTHFSERGRELRLVRLLSDTGTRFGFGIDEATALLVGRSAEPQTAQFQVIGAGGVFIADLPTRRPDVVNTSRWQSGPVLTHYLTRDDRASLVNQQLRITPARWKQLSPPGPQLLQGTVLPRDEYRQLANQLCRQPAARLQASAGKAQLSILRASPDYTGSAQAWSGAQQHPQHGRVERCSYQNFLLQISG